ncbi:EF-hand calcium-binding domain-containing protein 7 [Nibea albiflora]|uniref:EF-hand calcium-binding domain-containing protein 7 n=1 Tax=Nibea albiflora TaxID=240163 RepID=A0ACB7ENG5_NIBAL|nr:EF-hand calcium-binding domain-containing protein 7 [Nibea albiflora]
MSFQESPRPSDEEEAFYMQCRAAYLSVFRSSLTNITSKQQLCRALQQAGRNPSHATLNKYWTPRTSKLNFDDFCEILKCEKKTEEAELMRAFKKMDVNGDGYISHSELEKALTTKGEKMTTDEVNAIFSLLDINKDGKLEYAEFCRLLVSTVEQCQAAVLEKLEANAKLKRQNFGSQSYSPPKSAISQAAASLPQPPETPRADSDTTLKKAHFIFPRVTSFLPVSGVSDSRSSSRPSSARSRRSSLSNPITVTSSSTKATKIQEPPGLQTVLYVLLPLCHREVLSDIFEVIDMDGNGLLSLEEYNFFELRTSGEKCDKDAWAVCKENFDMRKNQLTRQGFMELNLMEATEKDGDPADLWVTLEAMGYNRMLELVDVDVYCEGTQPSTQPLSMDSGPKLLNQAVQKSITARTGAKALRGQDNVFIYTYRGEHRLSSLIANKTNQKVTVHVNNEQSRNCCSSRGMSVFAVEVPARTKMVCQHILPINERQDWTYNCVETILPCT